MTKPGYLPEAYHPNALDLHMDEIRNEAAASLGLSEKAASNSLSTEEAAQLGQAIADRSASMISNVNLQSE